MGDLYTLQWCLNDPLVVDGGDGLEGGHAGGQGGVDGGSEAGLRYHGHLYIDRVVDM